MWCYAVPVQHRRLISVALSATPHPARFHSTTPRDPSNTNAPPSHGPSPDEVTDTIAAVDAIDYTLSTDGGGKEGAASLLDDSPRGPVEAYDAANIIDIDDGFR